MPWFMSNPPYGDPNPPEVLIERHDFNFALHSQGGQESIHKIYLLIRIKLKGSQEDTFI